MQEENGSQITVEISECDKYINDDFKDAQVFYDYMKNFFKNQKPHSVPEEFTLGSSWLFRGHWDADWDLLPVVFREDKKDDLSGEDKENERKKYLKTQVERESIGSLFQFMRLANRVGLDCSYSPAMVEYMALLRENYDKELNDDNIFKKWPRLDALPVMAKAQHHGLGTRLLDFSYNILTAVYFAASEIYVNRNDCKTDKKIALWAFHSNNMASLSHEKGKSRYLFVPAEQNRNNNIFAQSGVLILDTEASERFLETGVWDNFLETAFSKSSKKYSQKKIRRFTLPQSEAKKLLRLLNDDFLNPATIMPSLNNVVVAMDYSDWLEKR